MSLELDGRNVTNLSYAAALNLGLTQVNPYGLAVMNSGVVQAFTVGFPVPLRFEHEVVLSVKVNESEGRAARGQRHHRNCLCAAFLKHDGKLLRGGRPFSRNAARAAMRDMRSFSTLRARGVKGRTC